MATIRDKGLAPCPRCLVAKSKLDNLGLVRDMAIRVSGFRKYMASKVEAARRLIYESAKPIAGVAVDGLLKEFSGVPTKVSVHFFLQSQEFDTHIKECLC